MNMNKPSRIVPFVVGLALGVLGVIFLPRYVRPYIPEWVTGKQVVVKGTVAAKEKKGDVLLVTMDTPEGLLLATFRKKVDEINLLVNEKDEIEFVLPKYAPFIDDPRIVRVSKEQPPALGPAPEAKPEATGVKPVKPKKHGKPQAAAPAPSGATGTN